MVWIPRLSIPCFHSKNITSEKHNQNPYTISKSTQHYFPNLGFFSSDSRILGFKHLLQQTQYNLSSGKISNHYYYYTKSGAQHNEAGKKWYAKIFSKCLDGFETHLCNTLFFGGLSYYRNSAKPSFALRTYSNPGRFRQFTKHVRDHPSLYFIGFGIVVTVVFGLETIPYSKRRHIVLVPPKNDKRIGDNYLKQKKLTILPEKHPYSVRVRSISNKIIEALETDLQIQRRNFSENISNFDDKRVVNEPQRRRNKYSVKHLEGLDWEVMVVKQSSVNAYCLPGGKIVVYTALLDRFKSDEEIATVIGHEVGHIVARHAADRITKALIAMLVVLFIMVMAYRSGESVGNPDGVIKLINFLIEHPWSQRLEKEADYIGLLLMATAGYDPQKAPRVYEMLEEMSAKKSKSVFFSTHPSGKKRAKALSRNRVMKEANSRYSRATESRKNTVEDRTMEDSKIAGGTEI